MTPLSHVRLGLAAIGIILWGYGYRVDDPTIRLIGIGFLAATLVLRFWRSKGASGPRDRDPPSKPPAS